MESPATTYNLLFVCTGNTCRSPMAAAIARAEIEKRGWTHVAVKSAGVAAPVGQPASDDAIDVANEHKVDLTRHTSTQLNQQLVQEADLILAMSPNHLFYIDEMGGSEKTSLMTEFIAGNENGEGVDDPYGGSREDYARTFEQLTRAVDGLLARLEPILSP